MKMKAILTKENRNAAQTGAALQSQQDVCGKSERNWTALVNSYFAVREQEDPLVRDHRHGTQRTAFAVRYGAGRNRSVNRVYSCDIAFPQS